MIKKIIKLLHAYLNRLNKNPKRTTNGNDMKRTWATVKEIRGSKKSSATWPRDF